MTINIDKNVSNKKLIINGNSFPLEMVSDYKVFNTKTYVSSPVRSNDGSIGNINDYDVFFVPRIIISFNFISYDKYLYLNDIINSSNEYSITYFDISSNITNTDNFYLTPEESEKLLYVDGNIKGILNLTLSFVGTLTNTRKTSLKFIDNNGNTLFSTSVNFGERVQLSKIYTPVIFDGYSVYWKDKQTNVVYLYDNYIIPSKTSYNFELYTVRNKK